ncbi:hypothetical protein SALBM311S_00544 [Streptomyces alboniger]
METFRDQGFGHLVVVSSVSAARGMPRHLTAYAASKAGLATLADGIRADVLGIRFLPRAGSPARPAASPAGC